MTRQYYSGHAEMDALNTSNKHIASLIIQNFEQFEIDVEHYPPYLQWKNWLNKQKETNDKTN